MEIEWFSLAIGLFFGWLLKVPFLHHFYKKAGHRERNIRRMLLKAMELHDEMKAEQEQHKVANNDVHLN